jgi:2-dehydro-3-deoxygluconokinase
MAECDLALLTLDDEKQLRGDIDTDAVLALCNTFGIPEVVIKRGAEPCLIQIRTAKTESKTFEIPANKVQQVVDTTAAGDSFSAAYIAGRLQGLSPQNSAIWGHALASTVIQHRGAIIPHKQMLNILDIQENP